MRDRCCKVQVSCYSWYRITAFPSRSAFSYFLTGPTGSTVAAFQGSTVVFSTFFAPQWHLITVDRRWFWAKFRNCRDLLCWQGGRLSLAIAIYAQVLLLRRIHGRSCVCLSRINCYEKPLRARGAWHERLLCTNSFLSQYLILFPIKMQSFEQNSKNPWSLRSFDSLPVLCPPGVQSSLCVTSHQRKQPLIQ